MMDSEKTQSTFHKGELAVQKRLGVQDKVAHLGPKFIRNFMPQQHQDFFSQLPFLVVGYSYLQGNPWVSLLANELGIIDVIDDKSLQLNLLTVVGDPLNQLLDKQPALGLLGIELATRRRNRLSVQVQKQHHNNNKQALLLSVRQSFGNCPQYITPRDFYFLQADQLKTPTVSLLSYFDQRALDLIKHCDTFFVSSFIADKDGIANEGTDVSHRGGEPGFIRIDDEYRLTIPDYRGNNLFNTFGNFVENSRAGLLFIDFEQGHMLTVTGRVEILWQSDELAQFKDAQGLWTFRIEQGRWLNHSLNIRWKNRSTY